jgi:von Willebrand factor type A domain.
MTWTYCFRSLIFGLFFAVITAAFSPYAFGQNPCLADEDIKKMLSRLESRTQDSKIDSDLQKELLKMKAEVESINRKIADNPLEKDKLNDELAKVNARLEPRLCEIFRTHGWLTKNSVGAEGVSAMMFLVKNSLSLPVQMRLFPVINTAIKKNEIEKNEDLAALIDRLFVKSGGRQLFGTQAYIAEGFLILSPLQSDAKVDEWRKIYNMPPLRDALRYIQNSYRMPVIKSPAVRIRETALVEKDVENAAAIPVVPSDTEEDVIRVDSGLVNLNVSVFGKDAKAFAGELTESDFRIFEDGREQKISFFARSEVATDLVLVLDISLSTANKIGLIRKSTRNFIEKKRPADRLAIVTFASDVNVISPLTDDGAKLLESVEKIKGRGSSHVWDALDFTLKNVFDERSAERRRAVVLMTDGADNALMYYPGFGSKTLFADLVETVRGGNTIIVPIYLDTEVRSSQRLYRDARNTLALLARESGGTFYQAKKIEDLNGVYEQVLNDLSKIYSIGYVPSDDRRDGSWRTIKVEIPARPELVVKTKTGYYAR